MTGKHLKIFLHEKCLLNIVTQDEKRSDEGINLLITIKKLLPNSEEIDEIISKLKKYRIKEIIEKLGLWEHTELGKKPWYFLEGKVIEEKYEEIKEEMNTSIESAVKPKPNLL